MPLKFNRQFEQREYVKETDQFVRAELEHAQRQVDAFRVSAQYDGRASDSRDVRFADSADRYLASLKTAFAAASRDVEDEKPSQFRHHFLSEFPDLIYLLTTAVHQRLEDVPYRFFTMRIPRSRVHPSEVTLEYAVTIRAAEAVSDHYHDRLQSFYPRETTCHAPLVTLSGGPVAMLRTRLTLCRTISRDALQIPVSPDALLGVMEHCQNLSCIKLPRWSSQHIRTYALAAHEHMHRVLDNAAMITGAAKEAFEDERKRARDTNISIDAIWFHEFLSDEVKEDARRRYMDHIEPYAVRAGNDLITLSLATYEFFQELWRFYRQQFLVTPPPPTSDHDCDGLQAARAAEEQFWNLRVIAHYHALELLADVGAIVIAGPAFAFAFRTLHPISDVSSDAWGSNSHPPTRVRVRFHSDLLQRLGFVEIPKLLADDLASEQLGDGHAALEAVYSEFLASSAAGKLIDDFIAHIADAAGASTYRLGSNPEYGAAERRMIDEWVALAKQVEERGAVLSADMADVSPAEVINAIWWKRIEEQSDGTEPEPKSRLAWRVALRNYGRLERVS